MGMIRIFQGKSKPAKKKPGWQQREAEYQAWLNGVKGQSTEFGRGRKPVTAKIVTPVVPRVPVVAEDRLCKLPSRSTPGGAGTKPVARPDILYKEEPELLARELAARERKFNVAPAYNKGGDQFVTEEELSKQLSGNKRR